MSKRVLVVDDEKNIIDILKYNLVKAGYEPVCAYDGAEGLELARSSDPDLILLDVMLPYMDGFEVCRTLRREGNNVPIIMITAREEETDKVLGLELGADDYVTKPFSVRELMARVGSNIRRAGTGEAAAAPAPAPAAAAQPEHLLHVRGLTIDTARHAAFLDGHELELTQREFDLLSYLASHPGRAISRQELMNKVWQYDYYGDLRAVDVTVRRLREKLEKDPANPAFILTRRGVGYYFEA